MFICVRDVVDPSFLRHSRSQYGSFLLWRTGKRVEDQALTFQVGGPGDLPPQKKLQLYLALLNMLNHFKLGSVLHVTWCPCACLEVNPQCHLQAAPAWDAGTSSQRCPVQDLTLNQDIIV